MRARLTGGFTYLLRRCIGKGSCRAIHAAPLRFKMSRRAQHKPSTSTRSDPPDWLQKHTTLESSTHRSRSASSPPTRGRRAGAQAHRLEYEKHHAEQLEGPFAACPEEWISYLHQRYDEFWRRDRAVAMREFKDAGGVVPGARAEWDARSRVRSSRGY